MNPEKEWPRHGRVEEIVVDCVAEAVNHNGGDQQRHREIEILIHHSFEQGHRAFPFFWEPMLARRLLH